MTGTDLEHDDQRDADAHRIAVLASSGKYGEALGPDCLRDLREDWPE